MVGESGGATGLLVHVGQVFWWTPVDPLAGRRLAGGFLAAAALVALGARPAFVAFAEPLARAAGLAPEAPVVVAAVVLRRGRALVVLFVTCPAVGAASVGAACVQRAGRTAGCWLWGRRPLCRRLRHGRRGRGGRGDRRRGGGCEGTEELVEVDRGQLPGGEPFAVS